MLLQRILWITAFDLQYDTQPEAAILMGRRSEPRKPAQLPVRVFGTDCNGKIFSENVTTVDVSANGARIGGVLAKVKMDEVIGLTYGKSKVHFRVKWVGEAGAPTQTQLGLLNLTPGKTLWDVPLPAPAMDAFRLTQ